MSEEVLLHAEPSRGSPPEQRRPVVTWAASALCVSFFVLFNISGGEDLALARELIAPDGPRLWHGAVWGLLTSNFVHLALWHVAFNVIWTLRFGGVLEARLGPARLAGLIAITATLNSGWQLLVAGSTGIGFSGVVYAMFGFLFAQRKSEPAYAEQASPQNTQWMLGWLVLCVVLTWTDVWAVGNAGHISGLAIGYALGRWNERGPLRLAAGAVLAGSLVATVIACSWMPWNDQWVSRAWLLEFGNHRRLAEHGNVASRFAYGGALMRWPQTRADGLVWLRKAAEANDAKGMNELAWWLSVAREDLLRNGPEAVRWAEQAYLADPKPEVADTLAAAYAETGRWDEAVATQERAIAALPLEHPPGYEQRLEQYRRREPWRE